MPIKRALLVGINAYPDSPLNGCLNDIALMYQILKGFYGFTEFIILDDKKATKKAWIDALVTLGKKSKPGDSLAHWYSGHGTQVPVTKATAAFEPDRYDECPVPFDMDWYNPFRDDDLNTIIMQIDPKVKLFFGMDCCFSGTILKNMPPVKNNHPCKKRYLPPPMSMILETEGIDLDEELNLKRSEKHEKLIKKPFIRDVATQGNAVLISGCSDKQTSADAWINGRYHGALTFYLAQTLKEANWKISYEKLVDTINQKLDRDSYEQDPQLECHKDLMGKNFLE